MPSRKLVAALLTGALVLAGCTGVSTATQDVQASGEQKSEEAAPQQQNEQQQSDWSQARVSYLGPEGTYTQEACGVFFGNQGTYVPQKDVATSVQELLDGNADYAVIPQENTIGGPIAEYLDEVVSHENVSIAGEVELPISQNLLAKPGTDLSGIQTVYSHKQGIAQGKEWLAQNVPSAEVVEVSSTAEGARMAAEAEGNDCAAIGSAAAAEVYGLEVVADNIQMSDTNKTRFYVLCTSEPTKETADRMAFLASGSADDLAELLTSVESHDLTIVTVHDRPRKTELGSYTYLVECAGGGYDEFEALEQENTAFVFRYLGSFAVKG